MTSPDEWISQSVAAAASSAPAFGQPPSVQDASERPSPFATTGEFGSPFEPAGEPDPVGGADGLDDLFGDSAAPFAVTTSPLDAPAAPVASQASDFEAPGSVAGPPFLPRAEQPQADQTRPDAGGDLADLLFGPAGSDPDAVEDLGAPAPVLAGSPEPVPAPEPAAAPQPVAEVGLNGFAAPAEGPEDDLIVPAPALTPFGSPGGAMAALSEPAAADAPLEASPYERTTSGDTVPSESLSLTAEIRELAVRLGEELGVDSAEAVARALRFLDAHLGLTRPTI